MGNMIPSFEGLNSKLSFKIGIKAGEAETTADLITGEGYPVETHEVTTEDGYILTVHRIPSPGPAVVYLHGYLSSSAEIFLRGKDSLGFRLAAQGFDVWVVNFRGNVYSRRHKTLDPDELIGEFWNFSFWEMGSFDLPAIMKMIINKSGKKKIQILGHSLGLTACYIMLDKFPDIAPKISLISGMAPIFYNGHTKGLLKWVAPFLVVLPPWLTKNESMSSTGMLNKVTSMFVNSNPVSRAAYYNFIFLVSGADWDQQDSSLLPKQLAHFPGGTSSRLSVHFSQMLLARKFQAFDFGVKGNLLKYNQSFPPTIDLAGVKPPHAIYVAHANDFLCQPQDYNRLIGELPNVVKVHTVDHYNWNHIDFLTGRAAPRLLYSFVIEEMNKWT